MKGLQLYIFFFLFIGFNSNGQIITTVAGDGTYGYTGDGGVATVAELYFPSSVNVDLEGNIYICDWGNNNIRKVDTLGIISTIAGTGASGFSGDGGQATVAELYTPTGVSVDFSGNILTTDYGNERIRKINTLGIINTICGNGIRGYSGDGGNASLAELNLSADITTDILGNIYISDDGNFRVRKISGNGVINTIAGGGSQFPVTGLSSTSVQISNTEGIAVDSYGNLFLADWGNALAYKFDTLGLVTIIAGTGSGGYSGDGGPASSAQLAAPNGVAIDAAGNIYIADTGNGVVRKINTLGIISTFAGGGSNYPGDGGLATLADINDPVRVATDWSGNVYIAEHAGARVQKVIVPCIPPTIDLSIPTNSVCPGETVILRPHGAGKYNWMPGNIVSSVLSINPTTSIVYTLTASTGTCSTIQAIPILVYPLPKVNLGNDTALCKPSYMLSTNSNDSSYLWNTGATTPQINAINTGTYWVTVIDSNECKNSDTINIILFAPPKINLLKDSSECGNSFSPLFINATYSNAVSYNWSNGFNGQTQTISNPGTYWVNFILNTSCVSRDSFNLSLYPYPTVNLGHDTTFCLGDLPLNAFNSSCTYLWNNGETTPSIIATHAGIYWVLVNNHGCPYSDTLIVNPEYKLLDFVMPNIVTPNNDNVNDYIDFSVYQFTSLQFDVFNRWGNKVFENTSPTCIWKPTEDDGTYFYSAQYQINCGTETQYKILKGFITIVR